MIELKKISNKYGNKTLFKDYSLSVDDGEFVIITGSSGCGKTTLLNIMSSFEPIDNGKIIVNDIYITKRKNQLKFLRDHIRWLFQNYGLVDNKTVKDNLKIIGKKCRSNFTLEQALDAVGLADKAEQFVYTLSGGEQQRVTLARLMYKKCNIIFADEPTGSLDRDNAIQVMNILKSLNEMGKTVIMVTHDKSLLEYGTMIVELWEPLKTSLMVEFL